MNLRRIILKEISFRKPGFVLSLASVVIAIAVMVAAAALVTARQDKTEQIIGHRQQSTEDQMYHMRDDYRRFMKDMGHNSIIVCKDQDIASFIRTGQPDTFMPEEYVRKLAHSSSASYNHLLAVLRKRTLWPEHNLEIILSGTSGQVPVQAKPRFWTEEDGYTDPIRADIPKGQIEIGYSLAQELGVQAGDEVALMDQQFIIHRVIPAQGGLEDITIWCELNKVQNWFERPGKINAIFALECMGDAPPLGGIVNHVPTVLPETKVIQLSSLVETRFSARTRASQATSAAMEAEEAHRGLISAEYGSFAAIVVALVMAASGLWLFWQFLDNVRRRKSEIGILRAIGVKGSRITAIFMIKAVVTGLIAAVPGYLLGLATGTLIGGSGLLSSQFSQLNGLLLFVVSIVVAPALCVLACWLPARWASSQDPVFILNES